MATRIDEPSVNKKSNARLRYRRSGMQPNNKMETEDRQVMLHNKQ